MRKFMITFVTVLALGAVAPLSAGAAIPWTIEFVSIGSSDSPPTDANGNGAFDAGDYFTVANTLEVTATSVALTPVGTIGSLDGVLTIVSPSEVRASVRLSVPNGTLRVFGSFSLSVLEGSGGPFDLTALGQSGIFAGGIGGLRVAPGETTTFSLTVWPVAGGTAVVAGPAASCDPQLAACGDEPKSTDEPPLAPSSPGEDGPAVGRPRMPDLGGRLTASRDGGALEMRLRIRITRPRLVRAFDVQLRGPGFTRTVRVRPHGRASVLVRLTMPLSRTATGKLTARIDTGNAVTETRERNNTVRARIG